MSPTSSSQRASMKRSSGRHRVADDVLHERGHQRHGAEQRHADKGHEHQAGHEIAVAEDLEAHERIVGRQRVGEEEIEARNREHEFGDDLGGGEPSNLFAAVEHDLQRPNADRKRHEPEPIEAPAVLRRRLVHENHQADHGQNADRQVDQKDPMPAVLVGEPSAERRPHDRPQHDADAPDRHGGAAFGQRVGIEQHGLGQRHQRGAKRALQRTEQYHLFDGLRPSRSAPS
jgi:hypothetical protein